MGTTIGVKVVVGFRVQHSDFWVRTLTTDDFLSCNNRHKRTNDSDAFCSRCGSEFVRRNQEDYKPTECYLKLVGYQNIENVWPRYDEPNSNYDCNLAIIDENLELFKFSGKLILGFKVLGVDDILQPSWSKQILSKSRSELDIAFDKITKIRDQLNTFEDVMQYLIYDDEF